MDVIMSGCWSMATGQERMLELFFSFSEAEYARDLMNVLTAFQEAKVTPRNQCFARQASPARL
jgi:hypothetical protein